MGAGHLLTSSLTVSDKKNIWDDAIGTVTPSDPADIEDEWGRSNTDERIRLVVSGIFRLPWGLTLAPVYQYGSCRPWTAYAGYDVNSVDSARSYQAFDPGTGQLLPTMGVLRGTFGSN